MPAERGKGNKRKMPNEAQDLMTAKGHAAITWAQMFKRVFDIDVEPSYTNYPTIQMPDATASGLV